MAKRKKHRKKQHSHKQDVVKNTTTVSKKAEASPKIEPHRLNIEEKMEVQATHAAVMGDVRYSLVLVGIIIAIFVILYVALQNQSVSNTVYGLIKLNSISF